MNAQARQANVLFIPSSYDVDHVMSCGSSIGNKYCRGIVATLLARLPSLPDDRRLLESKLAAVADHLLPMRQIDALEQIAQLMLGVATSKKSLAAAEYYRAECLRRRGDFGSAAAVFEHLVEATSPVYRARALQCLGAIHYDTRELDEAARFFVSAGEIGRNCDLRTTLQSQAMLAVVRSVYGDHKRALDDLERLFPLARIVARHYPAIYLVYLNSLAVELGEVGRLNEAHQVLRVPLASPFAAVNPEWTETLHELQAKRTTASPSVVAITRAPEATESNKVQSQSKPQRAKSPGADGLSVITTSPPTKRAAASAAVRHPVSRLRFDRISASSIKPRAPPPNC